MWIWIVSGLAALLIFIGLGYRWPWTGFGETSYSKAKGEQEVQPKKTLWDWLDLLIVPAVLALGGLWFAAQQDARQQAIEEQRAASERQLEEQRAQDVALQTYLDQMTQLMLERNLLEAETTDTVYTIARARTTTTIGRLDAQHNRSLTHFLSESGLTGSPLADPSLPLLRFMSLQGADLAEADLIRANLLLARLEHANLEGAFLMYASLQGAHLNDADLSGATLFEADLDREQQEDDDDRQRSGRHRVQFETAHRK